jgi:hypothetical protein
VGDLTKSVVRKISGKSPSRASFTTEPADVAGCSSPKEQPIYSDEEMLQMFRVRIVGTEVST